MALALSENAVKQVKDLKQTQNLPEPWYASPDAHLCTIKDFADLVELVDAEVEEAVAFNTSGQRLPIRHSISLPTILPFAAMLASRRPALCSATQWST